MSQENLELLGHALAAFNCRDLDGFLKFVDPEVEFTPHVVMMEGRYRGHEGVRRWWEDLFAVFPDWAVEGDARCVGDQVTLATLRVRGHGGESGTPVDQMLWQIGHWTEAGRLLRITNYATEAEALVAAGLRE
jgi:ketosteroid isomerase-like protein